MERGQRRIDGLPNMGVPRPVSVAVSLREDLQSTSITVLTIPSPCAEDAYGHVTPFMGGKRGVMGITGNIRRGALLALDRVVRRRLPRTGISILSNPDRTRRIKGKLPAAYIMDSRRERATRCLRKVFVDPIFEICAAPSVLKIRLNTTLGGIVTLTTKATSNLKCNSGAGTTLVAEKVTRVSHLNIGVKTHVRAFCNLSKVKSLVIAYTDIRDHGQGTKCLVKGKCAVRRTVTRIGVVIRNICSTGTTGRLTRGCSIRVPVVARVGGILFRKGDTTRTIVSLVMESGGIRAPVLP